MVNLFIFVILIAIDSLSLASLAADNSQTINFAVSLVVPTCNVGQSGLATGNTLDFGNIEPSQVVSTPPTALQKTFTLTLHDCNTSGSPGQKPKLKLTSGQVCLTHCGTWGDAMFSDGASAQGVGFIVRMNDNTVNWDYNGPHYRNGPNDEIDLAATAGSPASASVPIVVAVSSGNHDVPLVSGELKAAVTFTFRYG